MDNTIRIILWVAAALNFLFYVHVFCVIRRKDREAKRREEQRRAERRRKLREMKAGDHL